MTDDQVLHNAEHYQAPVRVIAVGADGTLHICGTSARRGSQATGCLALSPGNEEPLWYIFLESEDPIIGGALAEKKLYAVTKQGFLYAIGSKQDGQPTMIEAAP